MTTKIPKKIIVSGIQPTGGLHLGNYIGAIRNYVRLQDEGRCFYFLADLHAITQPHDPAALHAHTREMAAALIACGVDPNRAVLFNQARVPAHAELGWLLNCTARIGWLNRMTQFKDKAGKNREGMSVGLYAYPVLQTADVLLYQATHVPVGEDQKQHIELIRDIAAKFHHDYADGVFTIPEPLIPTIGARIMSLRDGTAKMSKSDPSEMSRINLTDSVDEIVNKIKKAKTDAEPLPSEPEGLAGRPEARNLVGIYAALSGTTEVAVLQQFGGQGFGTFKPALADLVGSIFAPITARFNELRADPDMLDAILVRGASQAREAAAPTLARAYQALGLDR